MTDIRRTMLWVVFSMSLVLIWDAWNKHTGQPSMFSPPPPAATQPVAQSASVPAPTAALPNPTSVPSASTAATAGATGLPTAAAPAPTGEQVTITTDVVKATFDSRGADLMRLELLNYDDHNYPGQNVVLFDQSATRLYKAQSGLIPAQGGATLPNHLTQMTPLPGPRELTAGSEAIEVKFESAEAGGVKLIKTYRFKRGSYLVGVRHEIVNTGSEPVDPQLYMQLVRDGNAPEGESSFYFTFTGPAMYTDAEKFYKVDFKDIEKRGGQKPDHPTNTDNGWVAMVQHYFTSAWLLGEDNNDKRQREMYTRKIDNNQYSVGMIVPLGSLAGGATQTIDARLYVGPQEEHRLAEIAPGLELVKDYGWFTILSKPLFWLLTQLHTLIGNWGWAIVALVFILKAAFYWLNARAYRSMAKMKAINPKVMEMRERLKDKPQQMQQEMMRIYREEKVNPIGGCLPIVAQMPFFIALYWVLLSSVEMRNAPWILWIDDLSAKDPFYILPLLMTGTTLLQTWLNPTPPDPMQARMMWIMPLMFSVMFFIFPAGLVLYWLTNNILSIAQQYMINRQLGVVAHRKISWPGKKKKA
ncbi:membrane protein insertase YidC [Piscinibacter sakaiensis]|uniref:membrane protein insertase YidC n=1 Tax=Piscinibacter sakaiensis TaxID=1547922 RepID=UPI003AAB40C9